MLIGFFTDMEKLAIMYDIHARNVGTAALYKTTFSYKGLHQ
jgi:hypothetical protein